MPRVNIRRIRPTARGRFFFFVLLLGLALILINKAYDAALPVVSDAAEKCVLSAINDAVTRCSAEFEFGDGSVAGETHSESVTGLTLNIGAINKYENDFSERLTGELERSAVKVPVRIGDVIGAPATSGRGPSITVRVTGYCAAVTDVTSEIVTAGINQSLYRVTMTVSVTGTFILPRCESREVNYETKIPLAETLVIGGVPGYYNGY